MSSGSLQDQAVLSDAARTYRAHLPAAELEEFSLDGLVDTGVPTWAVALHGEGLAGWGFGYGATTADATTGAYGELAEVVLPAAAATPDRVQGSYTELVRREGSDRVADPRTLCLEAGSAYDHDRPLQWLPTTRLADGERVWVPAELVASSAAELPGASPPAGWLTRPISNGQGAGLSREQAVSHALLELLQRDGNGLSFRAMDAGVVIDLAGLTDLVALDALARLTAAGVDPVVKLAATDFGLVDAYCVGAGTGLVGHGAGAGATSPIAVTACGEAAHLDAALAVRKAVLEFAAARARKCFMHGPLDAVARVATPGYLARVLGAETHGPSGDHGTEEPRALAAMLRWAEMSAEELRSLLEPTALSRRSVVAFADLPSTPVTGGAQGLLDDVAGRLAAEGMGVLVAETTAGPVTAVKAVVPGLEVETMSYGRIGERGVAKLLAREPGAGRELVAVGDRPDGAGWAAVHLTPDAEERLGGPAWLDLAGTAARTAETYPLYREPGRHAVARARAAARSDLARRQD